MTQAIILFGHGSRDPLWREPIESAARRVAATTPGALVRCAYLELTQPDLPTAAAELAGQGATAIRIVPMFLGTGRHAREDLPRLLQALQASHPGVDFELRKAVGEDDRVLDMIARIASE